MLRCNQAAMGLNGKRNGETLVRWVRKWVARPLATPPPRATGGGECARHRTRPRWRVIRRATGTYQAQTRHSHSPQGHRGGMPPLCLGAYMARHRHSLGTHLARHERAPARHRHASDLSAHRAEFYYSLIRPLFCSSHLSCVDYPPCTQLRVRPLLPRSDW